MPIDPAMLAKSIGTLTDLQPQQDLVGYLVADRSGALPRGRARPTS